MVLEVVVVFLFSLGLLLLNSRFLIEVLIHFSKKVGLKEIFVGTFILSIGTSMPEIIDSVIASSNGSFELVLGLLIGSNLTNLLLVLGVSLIMSKSSRRIPKLHKKEFLILSGVTMIFYLLIFDGVLSRLEGFLLISLFFCYHFFFHRSKHRFFSKRSENLPFKLIRTDMILTMITMFSIIVSGWVLINSTILISSGLKINQGVVGLVILSLGTSLPELIIAIISSKKHLEISLGNVYGSNIVNLLFAGGLSALINPLTFNSPQISLSAVFLVFVTLMLTIFLNLRKYYNKTLGVFLIITYVIFLNLVYLG